MKLEIKEGSENYACQVIKLPPKQAVVGLDKLVKVTYQGNDVLTSKDSDENKLYLFFPVESALAVQYLTSNNEYRETTLNVDRSKKGFFENSGRVKAIKFKGVISSGYVAPLDSLSTVAKINGFDYTKLKLGDEFTTINDFELCKKYKVVRQQGSGSKESRFNKKLKRFDKLVPNQFRFHQSTPPLAKCISHIQPDDTIVITDKWHGTSAVFANVLIKKELGWKEKLAKFLGVNIVDTKYDNLYSSRSVIKNQYINKEVQPGYYNEDIWGVVNKELEGKIEAGITIYGEIVGYLPGGKEIQKGYDYGCDPGLVGAYYGKGIRSTSRDTAEHKFLVYRITYTKPDGNVIEFSWNQLKSYCKKYTLETAKELFIGRAGSFCMDGIWPDELLTTLSSIYLEGDCKYCTNKVPAEGIVVRRDNAEGFDVYKLKSKRFVLKETESKDKGEIDIEEDQPDELAPFYTITDDLP